MDKGLAHSGLTPSIPGELVARLEVASEGSRELDLAIHETFFPVPAKGYPMPDGTVLPPGWGRGLNEPAYSTSLDAALALAERVLGDEWVISINRRAHWNGGPIWTAHVTDGCRVCEDWLAPTPALALCIAILKATTAAPDKLGGGEPSSASERGAHP